MSREISVLPKSSLSQTNYESMENYASHACFQLSNTMEVLLTSSEESPLEMEHIDKAIDCADAMVKMLAMFHKGREIQAKIEAVEKIDGLN